MTANLVGLEWFAEKTAAPCAEHAETAAMRAEVFVRQTVPEATESPAPTAVEELLQEGLSYDRIALKVRNGTKELLSAQALRARQNLSAPFGSNGTSITPKWLRDA